MTPRRAVDPYHSHSFAELSQLDTAYRDGLFADQVVLITGAAGGIGQAMCVLFGRLGATIVGTGRTASSLDTLATDLDSIGVRCQMIPMTVRDPEAVRSSIDAVWDEQGRLDHVDQQRRWPVRRAGVRHQPQRLECRGRNQPLRHLVHDAGVGRRWAAEGAAW